MSTDDHDDNSAGLRLKREVESYLRGEAPPPAELARAPRLQGWRAVIVRARGDDGRLRLLMILTGRVIGHPHHADGRTIRTSEVIWLDRNRNWRAAGIPSTGLARRPATELPEKAKRVRREREARAMPCWREKSGEKEGVRE
jgi:hypothetical protein